MLDNRQKWKQTKNKNPRYLNLKPAGFFLLALFFLLISIAKSGAADGNGEQKRHVFPVELTSEEKLFLKDHPVIRVASEMDWPPFDFVQNNSATGFSVDIILLIAEKTGISVEFINGYTWGALLKMGMEKKLDIFPAIWKTVEREAYFNFSDAYIDTPFILVVHKDETRIHDIYDLNGRCMTGIQGFASTEQTQKYFPDIQIIEVDNATAGLRAVSYGKADAYLGSMAETNFAIRNHLIPNLKISGETNLGGHISVPQLHVGIRNDWPLLMDIIQKGMDAISYKEKQRLQDKWLKLDQAKNSIRLTAEEHAYLNTHPELRVAFDADWPPVEYLDPNGKMIGIAWDYIEKISQRLGTHIKMSKIRPWPEMVEAVKSGQLDFFSAVTPTEKRRKWFAFTSPYLSFSMVILTRDDMPYIGGLDELKDKEVAVAKGYVSHELLEENYPDIVLEPVENVKQGLLAVSNKTVFAFVGSLAVISHVMGREGLTGLKISGETPYKFDLAMGTRKENIVLAGLLQKALSSISMEERNAISVKWSRLTFEQRVNYGMLWKVGAAVFLIFFFILYWNRRLRIMARQLKSARDEAEAANNAKSIFLANMSHELRTPLNAVLGFSQIMSRDPSMGSDQKENLQTIIDSGNHLLTLLNDILDMSKIEAGRVVLSETIFELYDFLEGIGDMVKTMVENKGLTMTFDISDSISRYIIADKLRLRQVLVNLMVNAVKYTEKGGISISVAAEDMPESESGTYMLYFSVQDTGIGIAPESLENIFDPFVQAVPINKRNDGTGLGLSICRDLVRLMGGDICLESEVGQGSVFSFSVQVKKIDASAVSGYARSTIYPAAKRKGKKRKPAAAKQNSGETPVPSVYAAIGSLPEKLSEQLKEAVFSFDYETTLEVIRQIRQYHKPLADTLESHATAYQFGNLQRFFEKVK